MRCRWGDLVHHAHVAEFTRMANGEPACMSRCNLAGAAFADGRSFTIYFYERAETEDPVDCIACLAAPDSPKYSF